MAGTEVATVAVTVTVAGVVVGAEGNLRPRRGASVADGALVSAATGAWAGWRGARAGVSRRAAVDLREVLPAAVTAEAGADATAACGSTCTAAGDGEGIALGVAKEGIAGGLPSLSVCMVCAPTGNRAALVVGAGGSGMVENSNQFQKAKSREGLNLAAWSEAGGNMGGIGAVRVGIQPLCPSKGLAGLG